MYIVFLDV